MLRSPEPVRFRAWGVSTDKPFLVNDQKEFAVCPSDYEQQVTDVVVRLVKPGGESKLFNSFTDSTHRP